MKFWKAIWFLLFAAFLASCSSRESQEKEAAQEALEQIDTKNYAVPYEGTGLPLVKIGIAFSKETRTVSDWKIFAS